jgi:hypothetical protein
MAKSKKTPSEPQSTSLIDIEPLSEKEKAWVELVYSDSIPLNSTWANRVAEATRKTGFSMSPERLREASRIHFSSHLKAEAYWSMVIMYHNVCDSIRTPEGAQEGKNNENSSYKVKIENALKLKPVMEEMKRLAEDLFKKNEQAEADFQSGKKESEFGEGAMESVLRELKHEGQNSFRQAQATA